jgi:hypothetical protein
MANNDLNRSLLIANFLEMSDNQAEYINELKSTIEELTNRMLLTNSWTSDILPPEDTPVLLRFTTGVIRIGELRWERPDYYDNFDAFMYWDDPHNDGQDWCWDDVVEWKLIPD